MENEKKKLTAETSKCLSCKHAHLMTSQHGNVNAICGAARNGIPAPVWSTMASFKEGDKDHGTGPMLPDVVECNKFQEKNS